MIATYTCPAADTALDPRIFAGPPRPSGVDVLLVEDDRDIAEMYRRRMAADGLRVVIAEDAATGLAMLRQDAPRVVLLDIRLPDQDGFHVLQAVRSEPELADVPVLMISNYGEPSTMRRALELGAAEYLVKANTTPAEVSLRVRGYLQRGEGTN
ncbi:MAG TPA: response regulator [Candidatus Dormibacteraeota bacterium]